MKKFILGLVMAIMSMVTVNAQSIEFHQSYGSTEDYPAYAATRVIASYFWVSKNEKMNLFTWNAFDRNATNTLLYTEHRFGKSNWYFHPEVRFNYWYGSDNENNYDFIPQLGIAYAINCPNGLSIYLTPKVMMAYNNIDKWASQADLQFSINTSYEGSKLYYEGYIDTNWISKEGQSVGLFMEQKGYYKLSDHLQVGGALVMAAGKATANDNHFSIQPYLSFRLAL